MEALNLTPETTLNQTKNRSTIFKISKRLSKLILKDVMKSRANNYNVYSNLYSRRDSYRILVEYTYDGRYIQCLFFSNSFYPERISILPYEVDDLAKNICSITEKIFEALPSLNLQNFDFKMLPGGNPTSECIILFSYNVAY